jgi:glycosyltransferase involved in cell wall biosynthesis
MHRALRQLMAERHFDAVHADQLWMAQYALEARRLAREQGQPLHAVLDQHNAVFLIPARLAEGTVNAMKRTFLLQERHRLARYEVETCQQFDWVTWVTPDDFHALADSPEAHGVGLTGQSSSNGHPRHAIIPICVDPGTNDMIQTRPGARRVTFLGGMHWPPNREGILWFKRAVWPLVRQQVPDAVLTVIGKDPPSELLDGPPESAGLEVTGYVADPTAYLEETAAFIVPLYAGGGMRVKLLDAWTWGLPVISTTIGAEGIRIEDGHDVLIADTAEAFAEAVVSVLCHSQLASKLRANGRASVMTHYNWRSTYTAWDQVYPRR